MLCCGARGQRARELLQRAELQQRVEVAGRALADAKLALSSQRAEAEERMEELQHTYDMTEIAREKMLASSQDMRQIWESTRRLHKLQEQQLLRRMMQRILMAGAAMCVREWAALTRRRKKQRSQRVFQTQLEDLEFDEASLRKAIKEARSKVHFALSAATAAKAKRVIARLGFRSLLMWLRMWVQFVADSQQQRREEEVAALEAAIVAETQGVVKLQQRLQRQVLTDARNRGEMATLVAADVARAERLVPSVATATGLACRAAGPIVARFPGESRGNGLHSALRTLRAGKHHLREQKPLASPVATAAAAAATTGWPGSSEGATNEARLPPISVAQLPPAVTFAQSATAKPHPPPRPPSQRLGIGRRELRQRG
jgi:hypothetical protein